MKPSRLSAYWWLLAGGILLLALLGVLQYRWILRASNAERRDRQQFLRTALTGVRNELNERLRRPAAYFRSNPGDRQQADPAATFAARFEQWRSGGNDPALVRGMMIGWVDRGGSIQCLRMGAAEDSFKTVEWPFDARTLSEGA